jgi:CubicO group peptidase (beta-lactamase class C family)
MNRREFLGTSATAAVSCSKAFYSLDALTQAAESGGYKSAHKPLDRFVEQYMRAMNAPGMTLVLADRDGIQRIATYGFSDVETKSQIKPDQLFQIGSISKSFVTLCLLQLHDEGKLDLHKPVLDYLSWFRIESPYEPITTHHLLTHTSGLPGIPPVFLSDPAAKHRAAYAPGKHFHYNNMAFTLLGHLLMSLDGGTLPEIYRKRIFDPLGMTATEPVITFDQRDRTAKNYSAFQSDRPFPRFARLSEAPAIVITSAAGCIASTPHDMGLYLQCLARRGESSGQGAPKRLLSGESFALFSQPHIKAEEFGSTASYGYGIAVDTLDGHTILRHTGGMISFASAMHVDLDEGVGAFASINAMQGYRPNPVAQYAIQLMRAQRASKPLSAPPAVKSATDVENSLDYAGTFQSSDGKTLVFVAEGRQLFLQHQQQRIPLENAGDGNFVAPHPDFSRFALAFGRSDAKNPKSPVVEVGWGSDWYINSAYSGPKTFDYPKQWETFVGHYRNENNWIGSIRIVLRKGQLLVDGVTALAPQTDGTFRTQNDEADTEWISFHDVVDSRAERVKFSGEDLWRVLAP